MVNIDGEEKIIESEQKIFNVKKWKLGDLEKSEIFEKYGKTKEILAYIVKQVQQNLLLLNHKIVGKISIHLKKKLF